MSRPLHVVFASVHAGGGHNAVRDALLRSVTTMDPAAQRVVPTSWTAERGFDAFHRLSVRFGFVGLVFRLTKSSLSGWLSTLVNPGLVLEAFRLLRRERPDLVLSTHVLLTASFLVARRLARVSTRVVNVIPDYGAPEPAFFPGLRALRADATFVNGPDTFAALQPRAEPDELFRVGTLLGPAFTQLATSSALRARSPAERRRWRDELTASAEPSAAALDVERPIVTFFGGSGFAAKCRPVLDRLLAHPDVGRRFTLAVLAGRDARFEAELRGLLARRPELRGVLAVFGFLPHEQLVKLYALTDVPVLGSLAHSSLQEFLELRCGPLLVHHVIAGSEPPYIPYVVDGRLGLYEPDADRMTELVLQAVGLSPTSAGLASARQGFAERAAAIRREHRHLAAHLVRQLERVAGRVAAGEATGDAPALGSRAA